MANGEKIEKPIEEIKAEKESTQQELNLLQKEQERDEKEREKMKINQGKLFVRQGEIQKEIQNVIAEKEKKEEKIEEAPSVVKHEEKYPEVIITAEQKKEMEKLENNLNAARKDYVEAKKKAGLWTKLVPKTFEKAIEDKEKKYFEAREAYCLYQVIVMRKNEWIGKTSEEEQSEQIAKILTDELAREKSKLIETEIGERKTPSRFMQLWKKHPFARMVISMGLIGVGVATGGIGGMICIGAGAGMRLIGGTLAAEAFQETIRSGGKIIPRIGRFKGFELKGFGLTRRLSEEELKRLESDENKLKEAFLARAVDLENKKLGFEEDPIVSKLKAQWYEKHLKEKIKSIIDEGLKEHKSQGSITAEGLLETLKTKNALAAENELDRDYNKAQVRLRRYNIGKWTAAVAMGVVSALWTFEHAMAKIEGVPPRAEIKAETIFSGGEKPLTGVEISPDGKTALMDINGDGTKEAFRIVNGHYVNIYKDLNHDGMYEKAEMVKENMVKIDLRTGYGIDEEGKVWFASHKLDAAGKIHKGWGFVAREGALVDVNNDNVADVQVVFDGTHYSTFPPGLTEENFEITDNSDILKELVNKGVAENSELYRAVEHSVFAKNFDFKGITLEKGASIGEIKNLIHFYEKIYGLKITDEKEMKWIADRIAKKLAAGEKIEITANKWNEWGALIKNEHKAYLEHLKELAKKKVVESVEPVEKHPSISPKGIIEKLPESGEQITETKITITAVTPETTGTLEQPPVPAEISENLKAVIEGRYHPLEFNENRVMHLPFREQGFPKEQFKEVEKLWKQIIELTKDRSNIENLKKADELLKQYETEANRLANWWSRPGISDIFKKPYVTPSEVSPPSVTGPVTGEEIKVIHIESSQPPSSPPSEITISGAEETSSSVNLSSEGTMSIEEFKQKLPEMRKEFFEKIKKEKN